MEYGSIGRVCEKMKSSFSCTLEGQHKSVLNLYIMQWKLTRQPSIA